MDERLQRQIEANDGIFEPLLVELHPDKPGKYRIVDGERRWTNCGELVAAGKNQYRTLPAEIIDRTLTDDERLRVWVHRHRQRKEWTARDKENVANQLVKHAGKAVAADILGVSTRDVDKLVDKVQRRKITNSKEIRGLRKILRDPVAKDHFLSSAGDIRSALLCIRPTDIVDEPKGQSVIADLDALIGSLGRHSWQSIDELRDDPAFFDRIEQAQRLLNDLKHLADRSNTVSRSTDGGQ